MHTAACAPASSKCCCPGIVSGGPSGVPIRCIDALVAYATKCVARRCRYGPVRPNGVIAHTTASGRAHETVSVSSSKPASGRRRDGDITTTSAACPERFERGEALGQARVERDPAFPCVVVREDEAGVAAARAVAQRWPVPQLVALGILDLDDVGAEAGEQPRAVRTDRIRHVEHADVGERSRHGATTRG